jgi:hypothetical protein
VSVNGRGIEIAMTEKNLNRTRIHAMLEQMRREAVPESMCRDFLFETSVTHRLFAR